MMFQFHAALSLGLIALSAGAGLFVMSKQIEGCAASLAKFVGAFVLLIALISTICTLYCGIKCGVGVHTQCPLSMDHDGMMGDKAMPEAMDKSAAPSN